MKATVGVVGETMRSTSAKARVEVAAHQRAHLLGAAVVGVVVAGRERVGADHDAPLDLGAEALAARALVHVEQVDRVGAAVAVADAVEAREVRARLGRRDDVVGRQRVLGVRQADLHARAAQLLDARDGLVEAGAHAGLDAGRQVLARGCPRAGRRAAPRPGSATGSGSATLVASFGSWPTMCCSSRAQSYTERVSGPIWSSELAKATRP